MKKTFNKYLLIFFIFMLMFYLLVLNINEIENDILDYEVIVNNCDDLCEFYNEDISINSFSLPNLNSVKFDKVLFLDYEHVHTYYKGSDNYYYAAVTKGGKKYLIKVNGKNQILSRMEVDFLPASFYEYENNIFVLKYFEEYSVLLKVDFEKNVLKEVIDDIMKSKEDYHSSLDSVFARDNKIIYLNSTGDYILYGSDTFQTIKTRDRCLGIIDNSNLLFLKKIIDFGHGLNISMLYSFDVNDGKKSNRHFVFFQDFERNVISSDGKYLLTLFGSGAEGIYTYIIKLEGFERKTEYSDSCIGWFSTLQWIKKS